MSPSRVPLGDIADFVNGVAFKPDDWEESGKRILRIQNLTNSTKPFNRTNRAVAKKYEVSPGDLLVSWSATLGVFVWEGPDTALVNQHIFRVVPDHGRIDPCYLRHMLSDALVQMEQHLHGATMKHVNRREFLATTIPLPPLDEQKRIAGILDAADALRAKRREALAELDTLLQSTFLDMFGDPVTNPMGWDAPPLAAFCKTGTGGTPSRGKMQRYYEAGTIPWVKSGELREQVITSTGEYITETALKETSVKLVPKDALLLALYGATVGRLGILGTQATTNQAVCHIIPNSLRADLRYMFYSLSNQVSYLVGRGVGGAQPNISQGIIKSLPIPLPPLDLQNRFATIVESVEQQKARQCAHLAELDTLFASLQSRAFRGDL